MAVILLLVVAVMVFLPVEKIRDLAMEQARESLGREVQVGEVSVSFMGGLGVKVADVAVMNPAGFSGDPLAQIQGVDLKLALLPLLKGEVRVGRLVLDEPRLNLIVLADGTNNFTFDSAAKPTAPPTEAPGQAQDAAAISVDNFSIQNGHLLFANAVGAGQKAELAGLNGSLVLQDPAPGQFFVKGDLKAAQMSFSQLDPAPELPLAVTYELLWDNAAQRLDIQDLQGAVAGFALGAQGQVQMADAGPTTHLKGQAQDLDLAAMWDLLKPMLPPEQEGQLTGRGDLTFEMTAPPGGPEKLELTSQVNIREASYNDTKLGTAITGLQGSVALQNAAANQFGLKGQIKAAQMEFAQLKPAPDLPADLTYDLLWDNTAQRLDIKSLQGKVADFVLTSQGQVQMAEAGPTTHLKAQAKDLDLGRMWSLVQPMMPPEQKGKLGGRGDLNVDINVGPAGMDQLTYQGTSVFRKASYTETELIDELQSMDAELQFNQDQFTVVRSDLKFNSGQFKLTGTLRDPFPYFLPPEMQKGQPVKKPHLDFALTSPRLDVDRLMPAASPSGAAAADKGQGQPAPAAVLDMEFPDLTASGTFQADSLIYMQVPFTRITGKVKVQDRVVTCSEVKGAVYGGAVGAQVDVGLKDLNDPTFGGTYQAENIEVNQFVSRFAGLTGVVFGGASMSGNFNAHGRDPDVIRNSLTLNSEAQMVEGRLVTKGQVKGTLAQLAEQSGRTLGNEQTLRDLATRIKVDQGRVGLDNLSMKLGDWGDLKFSGFYSFTGNLDYNGGLKLTPEATDRLFASGVMAELAKLLGSSRPARLDLPLTVGGTRTDPKIKLDLGTVTSDLQKKAVEQQKNNLKEEAKDQLNDKLGDLLKKWK